MQAQREAPPDMQCKDKFLLQAVIVEQGVTTKDITAEMVGFFPPGCLFSMFMPCYPHSEILWHIFGVLNCQFNKESGKVVEEIKLRVVYIPANPPSPVPEESEEGSPPRSINLENGSQSSSVFDAVSGFNCPWNSFLLVSVFHDFVISYFASSVDHSYLFNGM